MKVLDQIAAWTGCDKQYWVGVAIVREHGRLSERELRLLDKGMSTCRQEEILNKEIARIKKEHEDMEASKKQQRAANRRQRKELDKEEVNEEEAAE